MSVGKKVVPTPVLVTSIMGASSVTVTVSLIEPGSKVIFTVLVWLTSNSMGPLNWRHNLGLCHRCAAGCPRYANGVRAWRKQDED